jgi:hypothetical protein
MASGAVKKDKEVQIAIILNWAGPQIIDIYDQFIWDEEGDEKKPDKLFEKLEGYCNISFYYIERWGRAKCVGVAGSHCSLFCTCGSFVRDKIDSILVTYC